MVSSFATVRILSQSADFPSPFYLDVVMARTRLTTAHVVVMGILAFQMAYGNWSDCGGVEDYRMLDGRDYRGQVSTTRSGRTCQRWDDQAPHQHNVAQDPTRGIGPHNFCRTPFVSAPAGATDSQLNQPGCFTTDPMVRYETCDVGPVCVPTNRLPNCQVQITPNDEVQTISALSINAQCVKADGSVESNAVFYYTIDGSSPTASSTILDTANGLSVDTIGVIVVRMFALVNGQTPTESVQKMFRVVPDDLIPPIAYPPSEGVVYYEAVLVRLSSDTDRQNNASWIRYWESGNPLNTVKRYNGPFWLTTPTTLTLQSLDALGRHSATSEVFYDIRGVEATQTPEIFPDGDSYFGGVRLLIHCRSPRAAVYYRLNSTGSDDEWSEVPDDGIVSVMVPGVTTVEAKAQDFDRKESAIATKTFTVYQAPFIACSPSDDTTYAHAIFVRCYSAPAANGQQAPISLIIRHSDPSAEIPTASNGTSGNSSVFLSTPGTYTVYATTVAGSRISEGAPESSVSFTYRITSSALPPPSLFIVSAGGVRTEVATSNEALRLIGPATLNFVLPRLPDGIEVRLDTWGTNLPGADDAATVVLTEGATYTISANTVLVSNIHPDATLLNSVSDTRRWTLLVREQGTTDSAVVRSACRLNRANVEATVAAALLLPTNDMIRVLVANDNVVALQITRLRDSIVEEINQQLTAVMRQMCPTQTRYWNPAVAVDLHSDWNGYAVVGVPFHMHIIAANGDEMQDSGSLKVVHHDQPCTAFRPIYPFRNGSTAMIAATDSGVFDVCVATDDVGFYKLAFGAVIVEPAENSLRISMDPPAGTYDGDQLQVTLSVSGGCNEKVLLRLSVDGGRWQIHSCGTKLIIPQGSHFVSVVAETNVNGSESQSGRLVSGRYIVGSSGSSSSGNGTASNGTTTPPGLTYSYIVTMQETIDVIIYGGSSADNAVVRVVAPNASCDATTPSFGNSDAIGLAPVQPSGALRTVSEMLIVAPNSADPLTVCYGNTAVPPQEKPLSMAQIGYGRCNTEALHPQGNGSTWDKYCQARNGDCSEVTYLSRPDRMCACYDGSMPFANGSCTNTTPPWIAPVTEYQSMSRAVLYGIGLFTAIFFIYWVVSQGAQVKRVETDRDDKEAERLGLPPSSPAARRRALSPRRRRMDGKEEPPPRCPIDYRCTYSNLHAKVVAFGDIDMSCKMKNDTDTSIAVFQLIRLNPTAPDSEGALYFFSYKQGTANTMEIISMNVGVKQMKTSIQGQQRKGYKVDACNFELSMLDVKKLQEHAEQAGPQSAAKEAAPAPVETGPKVDRFCNIPKKHNLEVVTFNNIVLDFKFTKDKEDAILQVVQYKDGSAIYFWQRKGTSLQPMECISLAVAVKSLRSAIQTLQRKGFTSEQPVDLRELDPKKAAPAAAAEEEKPPAAAKTGDEKTQ